MVEDNERNRYLLCYIVESLGLAAIPARTGEEAVELALGERPDLVLMDVQLPGIDGLEAVRRIRESPADGGMKILAVTSFAMLGDRERLLDSGFDGYVEKPIAPADLMILIRGCLGLPAGGAGGAEGKEGAP